MSPGPRTHDRIHPRPQLRRPWRSLEGTWDFAIDPEARWRTPAQVRWRGTIEVPFAPETPRSGVGHQGFYRACWYRRVVEVPRRRPGWRLVVHFGAVDTLSTVWINGHLAGHHEGGYTPFRVEVDPYAPGERFEIVVRAYDDPHDLAKPRGKQDWQAEPHSIWYPRTTGIWQTVWMEELPPVHISRLRWVSNLARWEVDLDVEVEGMAPDQPAWLFTRLRVRDQVLVEDLYRLTSNELHRRIALSDPGIDDSRNGLLWSPSSPTLIEAQLEVRDGAGDVLDAAVSYTALREIGIQGDRVLLNGRPFPLRLVLDQGYWPDTGLTAPDDAALRKDVELVKAMGFNGVRKHQKVEDPRYLYFADHLGLLVWEEMPSAYRFTRSSIHRLVREWREVLERDSSHPCIMAWVPFNESWGVPNLPSNPAERDYVKALYFLTRTIDPTRPVIGNDGWEALATDIIGIHDYDAAPERIRRRYQSGEVRPRLFRHERPGGRLLVLDEVHKDHPVVLSEFGGIALVPDSVDGWGYSRARTPEDLQARYAALMEVVSSLEMLAGFCYTQFTDTYQEANGLLYMDRTPKFPLPVMAAATQGQLPHREDQGEVDELPTPAMSAPPRN